MNALKPASGDRRISESYGGRSDGASVWVAMRAVGECRGAVVPAAGTQPSTLESIDSGDRPAPRLEPGQPIEGTRVIGRLVPGTPAAVFGAFLDGIQRSVVVGHLNATIPVVHGTIGAAIRERRDRALHTWKDGVRIERALYLPVALAGPDVVAGLTSAGFAIVDTERAAERSGHPHELLGFARQAIQRRREDAEAALANAWCARETRPLYVDGGIGAFADASRSHVAVGVIKSHHTLYVDADAVHAVAALQAGHRSTAFLVSTRQRTRVVSWYLRLRAGDGGDPLGGIVRIEVAEGGFTAARADEVSRWVLAEREPVALSDPRWRVMAYGIRDCERFLRAVAG